MKTEGGGHNPRIMVGDHTLNVEKFTMFREGPCSLHLTPVGLADPMHVRWGGKISVRRYKETTR
jgi:hypothetical protein